MTTPPLLLPEKATKTLRVFSFGGGVQSTAVLVLQAQRQIIPYDVFVFANVGNDSENPDTLRYMREYTRPFAEQHGIPLIEVQKTTRGEPETLLQYIYRTKRSIPIPAYLSTGAPGNRACTKAFKIQVIDRWIKTGGFTHAIVGIGISTDEGYRASGEQWSDRYYSSKPFGFWKRREHPLLDMGISRQQARKIVKDAGLPAPPKSSCWFCPYTRPSEWIDMKRRNPELFVQAVELEKHINEKRQSLGRDRVYLHTSLIQIQDAVADQLPLFDDAVFTCESGFCMV